MRIWWSENSPGCSTMSMACDGSTLTATSWPRLSMLLLEKVSRWASWSWVCVPAITRMQPETGKDAVKATQAVTTSGLDRPQ